MLDWQQLLNHSRRKDKTHHQSMNSAGGRVEIERDFDRILFATPTRRMADKTQVFPLEKNDSVRTRLTHSHEVSNLARSIGVRLAFEFPEQVFGSQHEELLVKRNIPPLLAAIGLAHDLGNPPFGHQGEMSIQAWFKKNNKKWFNNQVNADFLHFDGNAQTFRLMTRLQILNDDYGLNLTYATLAAMIKYPSFWSSIDKGGYKKSGIFESERSIVEDVWKNTGLGPGLRHPLTYIMEACDDIAYATMDAEDTVKKGYASFYDLIDHLEHYCQDDELMLELINSSKKKNTEFKQESLSSNELNDISMQMLRVKAISLMVTSVVDTFVTHCRTLMANKNAEGFNLVNASKANALCRTLKIFDAEYGYQHKTVLELELRGSNYIHSLMDMLWEGINNEGQGSLFAQYAFGQISENYRRVYNKNPHLEANYKKAQLLCDVLSGMTDSYIISLHDELKPLYDGYSRQK